MKAYSLILVAALLAVAAAQSLKKCKVAASCTYPGSGLKVEFRTLPIVPEGILNKPKPTVTSTAGGKCKSRYSDFDWITAPRGYQYKFLKEDLTYKSALQLCEVHGGKLFGATLRDSAALSYFQDNIMQQNNVQGVWVSASDSRNEGDWKWENGETLQKNSKLWAGGQPDNWDNADCAWVNGWQGKDIKLDDGSCKTKFKVFCERVV